MKNIIFIAPPAAGKGTQSDLLVKKYGYNHISTGDILRQEVNKNTDLGIKINNLMQNGSFVGDDIVSKLLIQTLNESDKPFILDGFPRNLKQIDMLEDILKALNKKIDIVIYLDVPYEELLKRVVGRQLCPNCKKLYNKFFARPLVENICDECNTSLIVRSDDNEDTFKNRYDSYILNTYPILNYYEKCGILKKVQNVLSIEDIFKEIEKVIK